jgi:glycosyltransferase involved in cell wall biosynthesis
MKITHTLVHLNRLEELQKNIRHHAPYVDRVIVSDGDSTDGSLEWLRSDEAKSMNVEVVVEKQYRMPHGDHTPIARNPYLRMLDTGWMLCTDTDEFVEEEACRKLHHFAERAEAAGYDEVRFQARDIWTYETGEMTDNLAETYWKQDMFVKIVPNMSYVGHTHSGLSRPGTGRWAKAQGQDGRFLHYRHEKSERMMIRNSSYLYWTTCGNAQNRTDSPVWIQFHEMMSKYGFEDWHEFNKAMEKGGLPDEIKDWMIDHRNADNPEEAAYFIYYFVWLHPAENIDKLNSERHSRYTWDYVLKCK